MATNLPAGTSTRILVLIEQRAVCDVVKLTLNHGFGEFREVRDADAALNVLKEWQPHLAVIEFESAGEQLLRRLGTAIESRAPRIPVLALTQRGDLKTKLEAFERGVDDIMTIPFSPEELLARVLVIIRRSYGQAVSFQSVIRIGEIEIDILNRQVRSGSSIVHLTGLEQSLLYFLAASGGRVVTRDEIMDAIWGTDFVADSNVVDRHIRNLRVKLQDGWKDPRFIATVPSVGYRFIPVFSDVEPRP